MFPPLEDVYRLAPELIWSLTGILLMLVDPFVAKPRKRWMGGLALIGATFGLAATIFPYWHMGAAYSGLLRIDAFSVFLHLIVGGVAVLVVLGSSDYLGRESLPPGEFYALVLFATTGMGILASAQELVTAFVGLEISSIASYVLASFRREHVRSNESALKYFLLGSFATAFFLYGVAMVYGATGTTQLAAMDWSKANSPLLTLGLGMIFIGLGFKVAAAPFQMWTPDVYEGAPTPVTAMLSSAPKAAAFALLVRVFSLVFARETSAGASLAWIYVFWIAAALTMCVGNLGAMVQSSVKRMLAYSSIAHAGYILVAIAAVSSAGEAGEAIGIAAVLFYLASYALMKLGAFVLVTYVGGTGERRLEINDYAGLGTERPVTAAFLSIYLLSLLGLPVTAGFLGKLYVFRAALDSNLIWLVVLMAVNSIIGAYYYLRVIVVMYMRPAQQEWPPQPMPAGIALVLLLTAAGTIYLGLFPNHVIAFATQSATSLR